MTGEDARHSIVYIPFWYPISSMKRYLFGLSALVLLVLFLASCGNPRPPEPPALELPKTVRDLRAVRKGDQVSLSWTVPTKTVEAQTIRYLGPTRICRSLDHAMQSCGTPAGEAPTPDLSVLLAASRKGVTQSARYVDSLPAAQLSPTANFTYAVEVLNDNQRSAGLSNQVSVPAAPTLPAPSGFQAHLSADGVVLSWNKASTGAEAPSLQHFYRVYRHQAKGQDTVIANLPMETTQFVDRSFEWEKTYQYRLDVVTIVNSQTEARCAAGESVPTENCPAPVSVEGNDTPEAEIIAHDVFPPAAPAGLQAVFSENGPQSFIDLVWSPNSESDLAGYNVFRHEEGAEAVQINSQLVKTPAYRDLTVQAGRKYFYSVSAVDVRGNQSGRSREASESVP
jgi:hypothetical protein